jgi:hypothetical protein
MHLEKGRSNETIYRCYCDACGKEILPATSAKLLVGRSSTVCVLCARTLNIPRAK